MAQSRKQAVDFAVYLAVRILVCLLQMVSHERLLGVARALGWLAYHVNKRHRKVALENLRVAFPEKSDAQRDVMVRAVYRHFCTLVVEMLLAPRKLHTHNWRRYMKLVGCEALVDNMIAGDRPIMIVTGHLGNWEMGGYLLGLLGFRTYAVARDLDNVYLDKFLRKFRQKTGQQLLAKKGDFDQMQGILATRGIIATLADQDAGSRGQFVPFFGKPASTHKAIALMALEYGVVLMVTGTVKVDEPMRYDVRIADVIDPAEYAGRPDAVGAITARFTAGLERLVREYPEQYFWLHRRWKHQPAVKKSKKAA